MAKKSNDVWEFTKELFLNKKFQWAITIIIFLAILVSSTHIRLAGLENLKDATTGKYLPADPDALYEYRVAETLLNNGNIDGIDYMRNPGMDLKYAQEMLPKILVFSYKFLHFFGSEITLDKIDVLYPVVAFAIGLIVFFFLCLYLSKSRFVAVVASLLLAYSPSYLSRTGIGISSHESLGMPFMFLAMLVFAISLNRFGKNWKSTVYWGILSGVTFAFSFWSWNGASNFVLMIVPIAFILHYLFGVDDEDLEKKIKFIGFSLLWIISSVLPMPLFGYAFFDMYGKFLSSIGILVPFVFAFMVIDSAFIRYKTKIAFVKSKYRIAYSLMATLVLGIIGLIILGKNPVSLLNSIYIQILFPMGLGRVGLTVAYYAQPYISDVIAQYTPTIFWLFVLGMVFMGIETSKSIGSLKHKIGFALAWTVAVLGMMFSRISASSLFNGTNFISQTTYLLSFLIFAGYFIWLYFNDKFRINATNTFLFAWMFIMLLSTRSAVRVIFVIYVFVAFAVAYAIFNLYLIAKNNKDSAVKIGTYALTIIFCLIVFVGIFGNPLQKDSYGSYDVVKYSSANGGPIANYQWQNAMDWVRKNTNEDDVFAHWWDYGYQVQTLGERTTVLDGGNANTYWNHMMARYVLTTPVPKSALGFMKTHNVDYLLIDPTDLGKYGAYSKIGSDYNWDRFSAPSVMLQDTKQTMENADGITNVYTGTNFVDEDINYNGIFLPGPSYDKYGNPSYKSFIVGIIIKTTNKNSQLGIMQPEAVFVYNNKQYRVPIRYIYHSGRIIDFGSGIEATFRIVPQVSQSSSGQVSISEIGSGIYLSPKVSKGLFAQLYLMDDPFNNYPTIKKAVFEDDIVVQSLKQQGIGLGDFVYFNGLRAPLKIWKVEYPTGFVSDDGFRAINGNYAEMDRFFGG